MPVVSSLVVMGSMHVGYLWSSVEVEAITQHSDEPADEGRKLLLCALTITVL